LADALTRARASLAPATSSFVQLHTRKIFITAQLMNSTDPLLIAARDWAIAHELGHLDHIDNPRRARMFSLHASNFLQPPPPADFMTEVYADYWCTIALFLTPVSFKARYSGAMLAQNSPIQPARYNAQAALWGPSTHALFQAPFAGKNHFRR